MSAGKGSRLGSIGGKLNKGLLPVDNKAIISHMIEKAPLDFDIVLATSYLEQMVKDYCLAAHPDRNFIFVHVKHSEGPGSGPGKSLHYCKEFLQRPFYLAMSDSLVGDPLPPLDGNWIGLAPTGIPELYSTAEVNDEMQVVKFINKSTQGFEYAFMGLCGVLDYDLFWRQLENNLNNGELVDMFVDVSGFPVSAKMLDWTDVGTLENYIRVREDFSLLKEGEFIYKVNDRCIKLFTDDKVVSGRMIRATHLKYLIPEITFSGSNLYAYKWEPGDTLYEINDSRLMIKFLDWYMENVFTEVGKQDISLECQKFYHDKTLLRVEEFLSKKEISMEDSFVVNGKTCKSIKEYIDLIDWDSLCGGVSVSNFHGDLQFDNIIFHNGKFTLLDWRQSFGDSVECGDVYYDLAKLYGGSLMSYRLMRNSDNFTFTEFMGNVEYSYDRPVELEKFQVAFEYWAPANGFNMDKIKILTAIIYLNMSPLHSHDFGNLLYFRSQEKLYEIFG